MTRRRQPPLFVPEVPDSLTNEQKHKLVTWIQAEAKIDRRYRRFCNADALRHIVGETLDYHAAKGNPFKYHDWLAVVRNRIRGLATDGEYFLNRRPRREPDPELPYENRDDGYGEEYAIGNVVDLLAKKLGKP